MSKGDIDDGAIDALERDMQGVLSQLQGDPHLEKFRVEYEKLHGALKKSHESEKRLMNKCRELNAELVATTAKVSTASAVEDDESQLASLRKEVDEAWKKAQDARDRESDLQLVVDQLKEEIEQLTERLDESKPPDNDGNEIRELNDVKQKLMSERDSLLKQVVQLRKEITDASLQQQVADQKIQKLELEIAQQKETLNTKQADIEREVRKKQNLERDLKTVKLELENKKQDADEKQLASMALQDEVGQLDAQLKAKQAANDKAKIEIENLAAKITKMEIELEQAVAVNKASFEDNSQLRAEIRTKEDEISELRNECAKISRVSDALNRKIKSIEESKLEIESKRDTYKSEAAALERELESSKKQVEIDRKQLDDLTRTRDMLSKKIVTAGEQSDAYEALLKSHEAEKRNLEMEISSYKQEAAKQRKLIFELEKERDRHIQDASVMSMRSLQALEQVKLAESEVFDYKKKIAEAEGRLKQQQALYESVRSDRNLYSKNLIEAQDEISELKRKMKIMTHQIDQLKEEISSKEVALTKEHAIYEEVEQQKAKIKGELDKTKAQVEKHERYVQAQQLEEEKLRRIVTEADLEQQRQQKELEAVINERDILGTQLIRRNDELALVYEKIRIQQSTLTKGEVQYHQRIEDIRLLRTEIKKLRREKAILGKNVANAEGLKREMFHVQRDLIRERMRCKALEEELETPMNIHRWRKLEGSDPGTFELIQKVQALQKRLIHKTEEVVEKELLIQEKEKQYIELKNILARQPGPEVAEQVQIYQQTLKDKNRQMKAMASELNMYQAQIGEYKFEIERVSRELQDTKKRYFEQKKKEQLARERERTLDDPLALKATTSTQPAQPRFTGGGFNLSQPV